MKIEKILVPLEGPALAESAIAAAVEKARPGPAALVLMRAAEAFPGANPIDVQIEVIREAEAYLAGVAERLGQQGLTNVETGAWYGPVADAIVNATRARTADVIVMTTHGRGGLDRLILGSVAESVLRGTRTPILLVRAPEGPVEALKGTGQARPGDQFMNARSYHSAQG